MPFLLNQSDFNCMNSPAVNENISRNTEEEPPILLKSIIGFSH